MDAVSGGFEARGEVLGRVCGLLSQGIRLANSKGVVRRGDAVALVTSRIVRTVPQPNVATASEVSSSSKCSREETPSLPTLAPCFAQGFPPKLLLT